MGYWIGLSGALTFFSQNFVKICIIFVPPFKFFQDAVYNLASMEWTRLGQIIVCKVSMLSVDLYCRVAVGKKSGR